MSKLAVKETKKVIPWKAKIERALDVHQVVGPTWLNALRRAALEHFCALGLPTIRHEDWKYTNVAGIAEIDFQFGDEPSGTLSKLPQLPLGELGTNRLVFINGRYNRELSSLSSVPAAVKVTSLADAIRSDDPKVREHVTRYARFEDRPFVALNTALIGDGAFIEIPDGVVLDEPIHLWFGSGGNAEPVMSHPRSLILVGSRSQATIVEAYVGLNNSVYFSNAVTEVAISDAAVVDHYKLQMESERAFHVAALDVVQGRSSSFFSHNISFGGELVRNDLGAVLSGEGGECTLDGLYAAKGKQHVDNHTVIDHSSPHCGSRELYKGILDGESTAVFNGSVIVRKDAQKTDARQSNRNLLLSETAEINTKPELRILADDVKCSHGATIGQIDREALFYLRSRGIGQDEARTLLTYAFANEILERIRIKDLRTQVEETLSHSMLESALGGL